MASPAGLPRVVSLDFVRWGPGFSCLLGAAASTDGCCLGAERRGEACGEFGVASARRFVRYTPWLLPASTYPCLSFLASRAFRGNELQPSAFEPACSGSAAPPPLVPQLPLPLPAAASAAAEGVETPTCLAAQPTVAALMHSSSLQLGTALPLPAVPAQVPLPLPAMVPTSTLGCAPAVPSSIAGSDGGAALSLPSRPGSVGPGHASDGPCQATSSKPKAAGAGGKAGAGTKGGKGGKGKDRATMTQAEKAALRRARR